MHMGVDRVDVLDRVCRRLARCPTKGSAAVVKNPSRTDLGEVGLKRTGTAELRGRWCRWQIICSSWEVPRLLWSFLLREIQDVLPVIRQSEAYLDRKDLARF